VADVKRPSRAEKARQTRTRMIGTARELFLAQGWAATTMEQIAQGSGVAVQTVYYTFKTKGHLLAEVVEVTAAGNEVPNPPVQRPWAQEMLSSSFPQRVLALGVEHGTAIYERVAHLWPLISSAVADPTVAGYWHNVHAGRRAGQGAMVRHLRDIGSLRAGLDTEKATDLVFLLAGHDPYRTLVLDAGWAVPDYKAWLFTTLIQQLLTPQAPDPAATSDMPFSIGGLLRHDNPKAGS
jgi:TetR/AcrR family transcriptional regulator, regulator of autoinduction and epiphytic fitness